MRRNEIAAFLVLIGKVTFLVFIGFCLFAGGQQQLLGPILIDGETRDPSAWDHILGALSIAVGLLSGFWALRLVRGWLRSTADPDHRSDRSRP